MVDAEQRNAPIAVDTYYIVPSKCTECQGFHEEPQCAAVCPVDCCVPDEMYRETVEELLSKKRADALINYLPLVYKPLSSAKLLYSNR